MTDPPEPGPFGMTEERSGELLYNDDQVVGLITVPGTWGWSNDKTRADWWKFGSRFATMCETNGFALLDRSDPYVWSTDLNGMQFWRRWAVWKKKNRQPKDHGDWIAGGAALRFYEQAKYRRLETPRVAQIFEELVERRRSVPLVVWTHSFGGNVAFYAAEQGLHIDVLITTGMPVRKDMRFVYAQGKARIGTWIHFQDKGSDRTAVGGMIGDGRFGWKLNRDYFPVEPDRLLIGEDVGHSDALHDKYTIWRDRGWLEEIRTIAIENACQRLQPSPSGETPPAAS